MNERKWHVTSKPEHVFGQDSPEVTSKRSSWQLLSVSYVRTAWSGSPANLWQTRSLSGKYTCSVVLCITQPRLSHKAHGLVVPAEQPIEMFRTLGVREMGRVLWGTQARCVIDKSGGLEDEWSLGKSQARQSHKALRLWKCTFLISHLKNLRYFTPLASVMSHSPCSVTLSDHFIFPWAPLPLPPCPLPLLVTRALSSAPHALLMLITMNTKKINYFRLREKSYVVWGMTVMLYLGQTV